MTMPAAESERIRAYLIGQAAKLTIPELVEKVRTDSAALKAAGESVPGNQFDARPAEGEWSAAEVWTHVLEMSEHGARSIAGIIEGGRLPERAADVISGKTRTGLGTSAAYWEAYLAIREPLYECVLQAKGDEHLDVKMTHSWFGEFSWREWFLFMRVHDLDHMRQLQAIAAALS
ncbi:DinB family protein [Candidatus Amarobacter glycogenicus]|uniref:DinB family protein n=1 Tax=Candidatus Amarobacter glycogenicus TaxID=3140699 RepID=UPI0031CC9173